MSNDDRTTTEESPIGTATRVPLTEPTEEPETEPIAISTRVP